jgi:hypothetical protein
MNGGIRGFLELSSTFLKFPELSSWPLAMALLEEKACKLPLANNPGRGAHFEFFFEFFSCFCFSFQSGHVLQCWVNPNENVEDTSLQEGSSFRPPWKLWSADAHSSIHISQHFVLTLSELKLCSCQRGLLLIP